MVERQLVELDVAGVDEAAGRGLDEYGQRVRDRMGHGHEFQVERADLELVAPLNHGHHRVDAVFLALGLHEGQRELGADQRDVRTQLEQVRHAADVVLVAVREHQRLDLVQTVLDVVEVRQNQIHARLLLLGEEHAAVDEQDVAVVFDHVHVAADLAQTAERHDAHRAPAVLGRGNQAFGMFPAALVAFAAPAGRCLLGPFDVLGFSLGCGVAVLRRGFLGFCAFCAVGSRLVAGGLRDDLIHDGLDLRVGAVGADPSGLAVTVVCGVQRREFFF